MRAHRRISLEPLTFVMAVSDDGNAGVIYLDPTDHVLCSNGCLVHSGTTALQGRTQRDCGGQDSVEAIEHIQILTRCWLYLLTTKALSDPCISAPSRRTREAVRSILVISTKSGRRGVCKLRRTHHTVSCATLMMLWNDDDRCQGCLGCRKWKSHRRDL
jgi:hypothetical protein